MGQGRCFGFFFNFLGFFCLVFVISSIPERDKQHFQGEKKNHVIRKQRRVRASHFHVSLFPTTLAPLISLLFPVAFIPSFRFDLSSVILLSPFVLPARFLIGPTCPVWEIGIFWIRLFFRFRQLKLVFLWEPISWGHISDFLLPPFPCIPPCLLWGGCSDLWVSGSLSRMPNFLVLVSLGRLAFPSLET